METLPPRAEQKSGGRGAEKFRLSPVRGWVKDRRKEWSDWAPEQAVVGIVEEITKEGMP